MDNRQEPMTPSRTCIEVLQEDDGWSVARDRIVDGHFSDLVAANDYAQACAQRAERAGLQVCLFTAPPPAANQDS